MARAIKCHLYCFSVTGNVYDRGEFKSKGDAMREARDPFWHGYKLVEIK